MKTLLSIAMDTLDCGMDAFVRYGTTETPDCSRDESVFCKLYDKSAYCPKYGFMLAWARKAGCVMVTCKEDKEE